MRNIDNDWSPKKSQQLISLWLIAGNSEQYKILKALLLNVPKKPNYPRLLDTEQKGHEQCKWFI